MKISELAKNQDMTTKEVLAILVTLGINNKKSSSVLNEKELKKVNKYIEENINKKLEVALIKKKSKKEEEEHKKIVFKKKKVIILKKPHKQAAVDGEKIQKIKEVEKPEGRKVAADRQEKKQRSLAVEDLKEAPGKEALEKTEKPGKKAESKEEKKAIFRLKEKKDQKQEEREGGKRPSRERKRYGYRKEKRFEEEEHANLEKLLMHRKKDQIIGVVNPLPKQIEILETITVGDLAKKMNLKASELIAKLITLGVMARINDQIDSETATLVAAEYECNTKIISLYEQTVIEDEEDKPEDLEPRPPVVTIMGHVDHGKTKLLDAIRDSNVVDTETGGITQHIGAYKVKLRDKKIIFIDTPGHEAFTMMRARGAKVTDIVVLVIAADDGVMPQTVEAISHAREANVAVIVVINKIDIHGANPDKVRNELAERGIVPEEWGGEVLMVEVSALKKTGIDDLLEAILLQAEMLDLKANPEREAHGTIIESKIDTGRGIVSTVLISKGTLKIQDPFVAGIYPGRVRAMFDEKGNALKEASPSEPVEVIGFSGLPIAGDPFQVTINERYAKQIGQKRQELKRFEESRNVKKITLENLYEQIKEGEVQELKVIVKADVQGSVEALKDSLGKLSTPQVRFNCIHEGVGAINETDIVLASASNAIIIGFRVRPNTRASILAKKEKVDIRRYGIIYDVIEDVRSAMEGLLAPELREEIVGNAEVRKIFKVPKIGNIAGTYVSSGRVSRGDNARLMREGIEIYTGKIVGLRRFKEDAREVTSGFECGIKIENFDDMKEGDIIEAFIVHEIAQKLDAKV